MKRKFIIIFLIISNSFIKAQINYEKTYLGPNSSSQSHLQLINLGYNDYKYVEVDYSTNQIRLYTLGHNLYSTVNIPIPLINSSEYTIGYISKSLFDCDSSMLEYAIMPLANWRNSFYVYREDGTQLFKRDSTLAPYCFGCFTGSYDVRPIVNSPMGAKLFLCKSDSSGLLMTTDVYSLCGALPENIMEISTSFASFVKLYPNPNAGIANFQFDLPENTQSYELVIYNSSSEIISSINIPGSTKIYKYENSTLSAGMYYYLLRKDNKAILELQTFSVEII